MMYRLITLEEAQRRRRYVPSDDNDVELLELVDEASQIVMNYLQSAWARTRQFLDDEDVTDEEIAAYQKAFGSWTDSSGLPLVDSSGDPLIVEFDTDTNGDPVTDSNGDYVGGHSIIPGPIRAATKLVLGALDSEREGQVDPITPAVKSLLVKYTPPAVA